MGHNQRSNKRATHPVSEEQTTTSKEWKSHQDQLSARNKLLIESAAHLETVDLNDPKFALATTDVFVEKAQHHLTVRARQMLLGGVIASILTLTVLGVAAFASYRGARDYKPISPDGYNFTLIALKTTGQVGSWHLLFISLFL